MEYKKIYVLCRQVPVVLPAIFSTQPDLKYKKGNVKQITKTPKNPLNGTSETQMAPILGPNKANQDQNITYNKSLSQSIPNDKNPQNPKCQTNVAFEEETILNSTGNDANQNNVRIKTKQRQRRQHGFFLPDFYIPTLYSMYLSHSAVDNSQLHLNTWHNGNV